MKRKLSISIDEKNISLMDEAMKEGLFRSRSHVLKYALSKLLEEKNGEE